MSTETGTRAQYTISNHIRNASLITTGTGMAIEYFISGQIKKNAFLLAAQLVALLPLIHMQLPIFI
jgi:hypothetical protein